MKKFFIYFVLFFSFFNISNAYIDYRWEIYKDYDASLEYMNKHYNDKKVIEKKIALVWEKIKDLDFDKKAYIIEKTKEKLLNYLYKYHIEKNNKIYYRIIYIINRLEDLKYKTKNNYRTKNYSNIYNAKNNYFSYKLNQSISDYYSEFKKENKNVNYTKNNLSSHTYLTENSSCVINVYWVNRSLKSGETKTFSYTNWNRTDYVKYHCENGRISRLDSWVKYNWDNENLSSNSSCVINVYWVNRSLKSGETKTFSYTSWNRIDYVKYHCENGRISRINSWVKYFNKSCNFYYKWKYYTLNSWYFKVFHERYCINGKKYYKAIRYTCNNWKIEIFNYPTW